jgi:hypothetical protein
MTNKAGARLDGRNVSRSSFGTEQQ